MPRPPRAQGGARRAGGAAGSAPPWYYRDHDYLTSPEGVMKVISVVLCIVLGAALAGAGAGAARVALQLASAALLAALYAAAALRLPARAHLPYFYTDVIVSTALGVLQLVAAALGAGLCGLRRAGDYVNLVLGVSNAGVVTGSAVLTYLSAMRRLDAARAPAAPPPTPFARPAELDV